MNQIGCGVELSGLASGDPRSLLGREKEDDSGCLGEMVIESAGTRAELDGSSSSPSP